ncbi:phage tail sheath C-terminal domain-containing protein [Chelatococcus reniformis]|uniref:Tail sheath protein n=1 Tax=Chelatococcus reniformis TaxID=1494448 RepID=A0A916UXQ4_9HYPH|nr:phage tail sheath C-terminal domain-containing protein [Chelatococcus reniformis]GGC90371.1 tail sheath protein [Chelatococcus reniformis]
MVSFTDTPLNWKVPLLTIEVDPSQAGTPTFPQFMLIPDYKLAAGTAPASVPVSPGNVNAAKAMFGDGSPLARAFEAAFRINKSVPIVCLPVAEPGAGVAATGTITLASAPSAAGTAYLYIAGQRVSVGISASDTTAQVATKIAAAITAVTTLPVTAAAATNVVTLTAKWKGITGNDIRVEDSVLGVNGGEVLPAGLALTYPANNVLAGGTGVPDWTAAIAALQDEAYDFVALAHTDTGSLGAWATEYGFSASGRWGWLRQTYGSVFSARRDTYANQVSWGAALNHPVISVLDVEVRSPTPIWEWAAAYTARAATAFAADPARPLQTLALTGVMPAPKGARRSKTEMNGLAQSGIAIQATNADGTPAIMREQTLYQRNSLGQPDNAYELATTLHTLAAIFRRLQQAITNRYPRHKLANDGTRFGPGQAIVTPKIIKAELIAVARIMEYDGLMESLAAFKAALIVERANDNPNRVNVLYPPDLINQLRHLAVLAQFRLQYSTLDEAAAA